MTEAMPAGPAGPQTVHLTHRQILTVFSGLMLGMFLAALDQTIVSAALPAIVGDLGGLDQLTWVVTSYLLTSTVTILLWGKLSDIFGRKGMFQASIATFLVSSVLIGLAPNMPMLIAGRGLQGIGAGGIMSLAFAIIGDILSPRERGKYMGLMGSVFLLSSVIGPFLGGFLVDTGGPSHQLLGIDSWRWIFFLNIPIGIPALIITGIVLRLPFMRHRHSVDYLGASLVVLGTAAIILGCVWGGQPASWDGSYNLQWLPGVGHATPDGSPAPTGLDGFLSGWLITLLLAVGILLEAAFLLVERRVEHPLLPLGLFKSSGFAIAASVSFVIGAAMFGGFVFLPTFLQVSTGVSATQSGFLLLPMVLGLMPMSTASGIIISKTGRYKWWPLVGIPLAASGMAMLSFLDAGTSKLYVATGMFLLGAGIGMVMQVMVLIAQNSLATKDMGVGTAANNFIRSMGSVLGVSLFGAVFNQELRQALRGILATAAQNGYDPAEVAGSLQASPEQIHGYPDFLRIPITDAVADGVGHIFLYALPAMLVAFVLLLFLKEVPLRTTRNVGAAGPGRPGEAPPQPVPAVAPVSGHKPVVGQARQAARALQPEPDQRAPARKPLFGRTPVVAAEPTPTPRPAPGTVHLMDSDERRALHRQVDAAIAKWR